MATWRLLRPPLQLRLHLVEHPLQLVQELLQVLHVVVVKQLGLEEEGVVQYSEFSDLLSYC